MLNEQKREPSMYANAVLFGTPVTIEPVAIEGK
jgi:hypothetical protein